MAAIGLVAISSGTLNQLRSARGVASSLEMSEIGVLVHLLTDRETNCVATGLLNVNVASLTLPIPIPVPITLSGASGNVPFIQSGAIFGGVRQISAVNLTALSNIGASTYVATLSVQTTVMGRAQTSRSPNDTFYLNLVLDAGNNVTDCWGASPAVVLATSTPSPTPSPSSAPFGSMLSHCTTRYATSIQVGAGVAVLNASCAVGEFALSGGPIGYGCTGADENYPVLNAASQPIGWHVWLNCPGANQVGTAGLVPNQWKINGTSDFVGAMVVCCQ